MGTTFKRLGLSELLPRYVFVEGLYARRRVLEVGAVASTRGDSARFLLTRGARSVLACDSDLAAVEAANKADPVQGLRYRVNVFDDLEAGSFDVLMVADLAPYVRGPELLRELARLLARGGVLIGGLRNPAGLALSMVMEAEDDEPPPTWGQLLDALGAHFPSVEVATQSPVLGYQLAFERGDGLQVDGSLAEATEAAYFVALAGQEPVRAVDPTWVQLPPEPLAYTGGKLEEFSRRAREWQERTERMKELLDRSKKDVGAKENDLKDLREQLHSAREAVARLTVQLEELGKPPQALEQQDELASRLRRLEAELGVARERAQDAEGRVRAAVAESEAKARAQKDAAIEAIAAQEVARLERSRREELAKQVEDARSRLTSAYQQHSKLQDELTQRRVELEQARLEADRILETLNLRDRELANAKEREVQLAEARSEAGSAVEALKGQLELLRGQSLEAVALLEQKETERLAAARSAEVEREARLRFEQDHARAQADLERAKALADQLEGERPAFDTEIQEAKARANRLARDVEVLAGSERTWRATAQELEQRLANTQENVEALSEQLSAAETAKDVEVARSRRLEKDLSTAVGAERSAREQAEVAFTGARLDVVRLTEQTLALTAQRDQLISKLGELDHTHSSIAGQAGALEEQVKQLQAREASLLEELTESRRLEAAHRQTGSEKDAQWAFERQQAADQAQSVANGLELKLAQLSTDATEEKKRLDQQVEALAEQLHNRTAERDLLRADLGQLQASFDTAQSESKQRQVTIDGLRAQLEDAEQRVQRIDVELRAQIVGMEETGRSQMAQSEQARNMLEESMRAQRASFETKLNSLEGEVAHLQAELAEGVEARRAEQALSEATRIARDVANERLAALELALEARDASHREELDSRASEAQHALTQAAQQQRQETNSLIQQLERAKEERDQARGLNERAQSEARGHQSGKLGLQKELDKTREELANLRATSAIAGGESLAMAEAREQAEHELVGLRSKLQAAEAQLPKLQTRGEELQAELLRARAGKDELAAERQKILTERGEIEDALLRAREAGQATGEELARTREHAQALESELANAHGATSGTTGELEAALGARRQAEELLLSLRTQYGKLEDSVQSLRTAASELPRLKEEVHELKAELQMLEAERERLSSEVERLEQGQAAPSEAQQAVADRDARLEVLLKRIAAQDAELAALKKQIPPAAVGRIALVKRAVVVPVPPPPKPPNQEVELEVFELDLDEEQKNEELIDPLLTVEEGEPLTPGKK